jgi:16S rRNA (guanine1516-N2)-methyltransferase
MQILKNDISVSFEEFLDHFPKEAGFLSQVMEIEANCSIHIEKDNKLSVKFGDFNPISIDIVNILKKHEVFFYKNSIYKDPLAKAIGLKKGKPKPSVLDATAGMLGDSLLMYAYGIDRLTCCERNPIVACLVQNAIDIAELSIDFFHCNSLEKKFLHSDLEQFDVIFYDPMYKEKNNKAAPKKEMAIFREIVGPDDDLGEVAMLLKQRAKERLVIKRSNKSLPIIKNPSHTISGKSTSYDVYLS